jgi:hypothetical protein
VGIAQAEEDTFAIWVGLEKPTQKDHQQSLNFSGCSVTAYGAVYSLLARTSSEATTTSWKNGVAAYCQGLSICFASRTNVPRFSFTGFLNNHATVGVLTTSGSNETDVYSCRFVGTVVIAANAAAGLGEQKAEQFENANPAQYLPVNNPKYA